MTIFVINVLQSSVPTSKVLVQLAFCPFIEHTFDLDYSRGHQYDFCCREVIAVLNLHFNKN